jgi:2,3-dimethylmalate lyase
MTTSKAGRLRALLAQRDTLIAPGCYDGLTARLVEQADFPVAYMSGLCVAAGAGEPDVGAITVDAMVARAATIARSIGIPLIADADSGYGGAFNVHRAVQAFEACGAAAIHLEDQPFPKKCAAMDGKRLICVAEMVARIKTALRSRRDPDFVIIGRTDAVAVEGLDAAIARAQAYEEAGADMTLVMSVAEEGALRKIRAALQKPVMISLVEGLRPLVPLERLREIGINMVIYPVSLLQAQTWAQRRMLAALRQQGSTAASLDCTDSLQDIAGYLGLDAANGIDEAFAADLAKSEQGA